ERPRNLPPRCRVAPYRAGAASRMGRSDDYRRYAKECLDMANTVQGAKARASLLQMAQGWLSLSQMHDAEEQSDHSGEGEPFGSVALASFSQACAISSKIRRCCSVFACCAKRRHSCAKRWYSVEGSMQEQPVG